jgi:Tol biopolymer transport system component
VPRQRPVLRRMMLAGGLAGTVAAAAVIVSLTFASDSVAAENGPGTTRVSVSTAGLQAQYGSNEPSISADGRYVAFTTDEPFDPIDKIDTSQSEPGGQDPERRPDADIYVRDTQLGTTTLISQETQFGSEGERQVAAARGDSDQPSISGDGRFIAYRTTAYNIAGNPSGALHMIVVCDRDADGDGKLNSSCDSTNVSNAKEYDPANPTISADGKRLSYDVAGVNPIEGDNPWSIDPEPAGRNAWDGWVEVLNLRTGDGGTLLAPQLDDRTYLRGEEKIATDNGSHVLLSQDDSTMAAGGTQVAFIANYASSNEGSDVTAVFGYDLATGRLSRLDLDFSGDPIAAEGRVFSQPALSGDGRRYAFTDRDAQLPQIRLYDRDPDGDGVFGQPHVEIASQATDGTAGFGAQPAFSADGRYLAFTTPSVGMHNGTDSATIQRSCLGSAPGLSFCDIVVRDVVVDYQRLIHEQPRLPAELASPSVKCAADPQPCEGTGNSGYPPAQGDGSGLIGRDGRASLSADGSALAFGSQAADLIGDDADTNQHNDVFRREFKPALAADPVDFGDVPVGAEAVKEVPLTHVGSGPLVITAVAVTGDAFDVYPGEACTTVVLHATESCLVSVRFKPTASGDRTGSLDVTIRGLDTPLAVALTGTSSVPPVGTFAAGPAKLDFGKRPVLRTSPAQSVTISNPGTGPLTIGQVKLSAATPSTFPIDYKLTTTGCADVVLAAGANCKISVKHRPTAVGVRPAVVLLSYTGPDGTPLTFSVTATGEGLAPTLQPSPAVTPAGRVIQVTGKDFPPGSTVKLSLTGMPGTAVAKAGSNGMFTVPFVVLPSTWTGKHQLIGDVQAGTAPGLSAPLQAQLEFVIVPGSPLPPDFDTRK